MHVTHIQTYTEQIDMHSTFQLDVALLSFCPPSFDVFKNHLVDISIVLFSYAGGYNACEFGDFTVVHALTGWLPEIIPLR